MPQLTPYHLSFHSGLHVGAGVENLNETLAHVPSDTLFSALAATHRLMGGDVQTLVQPFLDGNPPFRLSSAFPFAGSVRFFPLPVDLRMLFSETILGDFSWNKPLKRVRYFSEGLLRKALDTDDPLDARLFPLDEREEPQQGVALQGGSVWLLKEEVEKLPASIRLTRDKKPITPQALRGQAIWKTQTVPRVTVDRIASTSTLFQAERVAFSPGCGLWFGVVGQIANLPHLLTTLGENGLGGERTAGYGGFTFEPDTLDLFDDPSPEGLAYLFSRYAPKKGEAAPALQHPSAAYRLEAVAGYLRSHDGAAQRRKRLWMVTEGSLVGGDPRGELKNVKPDYDAKAGELPHSVWRSGLALALNWSRNLQSMEAHHA